MMDEDSTEDLFTLTAHKPPKPPRSKSANPNKSPSITWTDDMRIYLLKTLTTLGRAEGTEGGYKAKTWDAVLTAMKLKFPSAPFVGKESLQSQHQILKNKFNTYRALREKNTSGWGWDPIRQLVTAPDDVWNAYLVSHPKAGEFRYKPFPLYDVCFDCFAGCAATGAYAMSLGEMASIPTTASIDSPTDSRSRSRSNSEALSDISEESPVKRLRGEFSSPPAARSSRISMSSSRASATEMTNAIGMIAKYVGICLVREENGQTDKEILAKAYELVEMASTASNKVVTVRLKVYLCSDPTLARLFVNLDHDAREIVLADIIKKHGLEN
jgi:hypothetical protein